MGLSTISFTSPSEYALREYRAMGASSVWPDGFLFAQIASRFPGHCNRKSPMGGFIARAFRPRGPARSASGPAASTLFTSLFDTTVLAEEVHLGIEA
jgi:hypothetical protein